MQNSQLAFWETSQAINPWPLYCSWFPLKLPQDDTRGWLWKMSLNCQVPMSGKHQKISSLSNNWCCLDSPGGLAGRWVNKDIFLCIQWILSFRSDSVPVRTLLSFCSSCSICCSSDFTQNPTCLLTVPCPFYLYLWIVEYWLDVSTFSSDKT